MEEGGSREASQQCPQLGAEFGDDELVDRRAFGFGLNDERRVERLWDPDQQLAVGFGPLQSLAVGSGFLLLRGWRR